MSWSTPKKTATARTFRAPTTAGLSLNIFAYNEEDEEAGNTTSTDLESRDDGDCGSDQDCVHLRLSGYMFADTESTYGDGEWTMSIQNDRVNDFMVDQFVIRLFYK